jgi:hypothetical protein
MPIYKLRRYAQYRFTGILRSLLIVQKNILSSELTNKEEMRGRVEQIKVHENKEKSRCLRDAIRAIKRETCWSTKSRLM